MSVLYESMTREVLESSGDAGATAERRQLVQVAAEKLREMIFAVDDGARIGALPELAEALGVGIVTVQQAARVLEHEGLLDVRRGPGGGYYGTRPDAAALERTLAAYLRTHPAAWQEAVDMTSLLFNELAAAAASCTDEALRSELLEFLDSVQACASQSEMGMLEEALQELLFRMVDRPLFELLTYVTLRFAKNQRRTDLYGGAMTLENWVGGRQRIIAAILSGDPELARFEANRSNRQVLLQWLAARAGEEVDACSEGSGAHKRRRQGQGAK